MSRGPPVHFLISSVASCSAPFDCQLSSPKYPLKAFSPQGASNGFAIGANALQLLYIPGFLRYSDNAPCPPMLCPLMLTRLESICGKAEKTVWGSSEVM